MIVYKIFVSLLFITNILFMDRIERQLLIFGNDKNPLLVQQQLALFSKEAAGIKERDIKITVVSKDDLLNKKYHIKAEIFSVILLGKDGTEKFRTDEILLPQKLFAIIDAMPMRQAEMNKNKNP